MRALLLLNKLLVVYFRVNAWARETEARRIVSATYMQTLTLIWMDVRSNLARRFSSPFVAGRAQRERQR